MLINQFLPTHQFAERHSLLIKAPADEVYAAVLSMDLHDSPLIRWLFRLRGLPASALTLQGMQKLRFAVLGEVPNQELLLGIVGRFWTLTGDLQPIHSDSFQTFDRTGYAKAAWNFSLQTQTDQMTQLTTETRIYCLDDNSLRRFRFYWLVINPFSAWIRREALRLIQRDAEFMRG